MQEALKEAIKEEAHRLGFILAGVTSPEPPPHYSTFENWLAQGYHGTMNYLATERSRLRRANPLEILPECKSILVLATPYPSPPGRGMSEGQGEGRLAPSSRWRTLFLVILPYFGGIMRCLSR